MQACAVLVNYKNAELTVRCIRALEQGTVKPSTIYVVDNATTNESKFVFKQETYTLPVEFIWNDRNVGFAVACNQGARKALENGFEGYIWLINNDTEPEKSALEKLLQKASETNAGITGSLIVDENGQYIGGVGTTNPRLASVHRPQQPAQGAPIPQFDYIEGSSFLISQSCIKKVGLLSEDFFLYFEESDYCYRAKKAGFTLAWATDSVVRHRIGSSTQSENSKGKVPYFIDCLMIRNRIHFALRNGFPKIGVWTGFLISLLLRIKRGQFKRVITILSITTSKKRLRSFIEKNGGFYA